MWSSLYELALLFGIVFVTAMLVQTVLSVLNIQLPNWAHSLIAFTTMGLYIVYCWTRSGQTLAQRTWQLKTVRMDGQLIGMGQAWLRYSLSYLGVLPALLITWTQIHSQAHMPSVATIFTLSSTLALVNWLALLGTSLMHPSKLALHERLSKSRTILVEK
jgi:uncharacterized RDD family membrane protein YckC